MINPSAIESILNLNHKTVQLMHNNAITKSQRAVHQVYKYIYLYQVGRVEILLNLSGSRGNFRGKLVNNRIFRIKKMWRRRPNLGLL